jgi:hypothetical protein
MIRPNPHKTDNHSEKILHCCQKLDKFLVKIKNQNLEFTSSLSDLNKALTWFRIREPSYEKLYQIAISNLRNVFLSDNQEFLVKEIAEEICGILPLHDSVVMGFIKRGIIKWQIEKNQPIITLTKMNPLDKLQTMSKILMYMSTHACKAIYSQDKKLKEHVEHEIFRLAIEYYEEAISAQNFILNFTEIEGLY